MIIPVKRGEENTDYVNASFIDVSVETPRMSVVSLKVMCAGLFFFFYTVAYRFFLSARHFLSVTASQGYRQKDSYMASQGPLQHTIEDFWRMIWEWRSCSIVMLTELEERGQVCV